MPTISQLPSAGTVSAADLIPISQGGVSRAVSIGTLLAQTQPAIMVEPVSLLGRVSIGPGGPDTIAVGTGLTLNNGTLNAQEINASSLSAVSTLVGSDRVIVTDGTSTNLLGINLFRGLFSAGSNITIDPSGTISSAATTGAGTLDFGTLGPVITISGNDLIPINQNGNNSVISYANLIKGMTIDQAQLAGAASDTDTFWVAQTNNVMLRQNLAALWPWIESKLPSWKRPVLELTINTTLDTTVHNNAILICSQPVTISVIPANMGSGFSCELVNLSAGSVTLPSAMTTSNGSPTLNSHQSASVRCATYSGGTVVFASISAGSVPVITPGQVTNLTTSSISSASVGLSWSAPATGGATSAYTIQFRISGTTAWTTASQINGTTSFQLTGLQAATSYDFSVIASNNAGSGPVSTTVAATTSPSGIVPGAPASVTISNITATSLTCAWSPPTTGGATTSYSVQYRVTGQTAWIVAASNLSTTIANLASLTPATSYDISIVAANATGVGPASGVITAITSSPSGLVTSITWNVAPAGSFTHGSGAIGVNVHVTPANATVEFGFSTSSTVAPTSWTVGQLVNTNLWGAYVATPASAGTWYAWAQGTDGSAATVYANSFAVT